MKRAIIKVLHDMESQLSGQSAVATYGYMKLCVKAEEMALLSVSINIEGEEKYIEEVASVVKPDDYTFIVIPHFDEDLTAVKSGIHAQYPAFKLEVESKTVDVYENKEGDKPIPVTVKYLKVTMPSVDDDRQTELTQDVNKIYEQCKSQMAKTYNAAKANMEVMLKNESDDVKNEAKDCFDAAKKKWADHRDKVYDEKIKEINRGHDKWQVEEGQ
jgi:ribosome recycling factor